MPTSFERIALVATEPSADILGAGIIKALRQYYPRCQFFGIAGPKMQAAGCEVIYPIEALTVLGLVEVVKHLPRLLKLRRHFCQLVLQRRTELFIGIDAADFNFPLEKKFKRQGIKTVHYNSPKLWAWRPGRIHRIEKACDLMLTLFPFENSIYEQYRIPVKCVGHPLADQLTPAPTQSEARQQLGLPQHVSILAVMPGSRHSELHQLVRPFLQTAELCLRENPNLLIITNLVNASSEQLCKKLHQRHAPKLAMRYFVGQSHLAMAASDVLLLASGTATLEAMCLAKPMVAAYRLHWLSYLLLKHLVRCQYMSLPNLIANEALVPEFMQHFVNPKLLAQAILERLNNSKLTEYEQQRFVALKRSITKNASQQAALAIQDRYSQGDECDSGSG